MGRERNPLSSLRISHSMNNSRCKPKEKFSAARQGKWPQRGVGKAVGAEREGKRGREGTAQKTETV